MSFADRGGGTRPIAKRKSQTRLWLKGEICLLLCFLRLTTIEHTGWFFRCASISRLYPSWVGRSGVVSNLGEFMPVYSIQKTLHHDQGSRIILSSLHHFTTSSASLSLHQFIPSSAHQFITSSLHHFITASLNHFITSSLHHFIATSSRHHFITSSLHHFVNS